MLRPFTSSLQSLFRLLAACEYLRLLRSFAFRLLSLRSATPLGRLSDADTDPSHAIAVDRNSQGSVATVREWGPVANRGLYGAWRHLAFTLRFARAPTAGASTPTALLAQAFAFLNGVQVPPATAAPFGPATGLGLDAGLDEVYLGGVPPADAAVDTDSAVVRGFEGSMDNVRLWWPPCPSASDPSR